jgi:hypothetical protein
MDAPAQLAATELPPSFTHAQIKRVLWGVVVCMLLAAIDQTVVVPAVPAIAADLNGFSHLAWIVSAYLITSTSAMPIYGKLSDLYGRRALLLPAIVLFVFASCLCALSQSLFQLIAFRALQGLGGGGLMSMAPSPMWWRRASGAATRPTWRLPGQPPACPARSSAAGSPTICRGISSSGSTYRWASWPSWSVARC